MTLLTTLKRWFAKGFPPGVAIRAGLGLAPRGRSKKGAALLDGPQTTLTCTGCGHALSHTDTDVHRWLDLHRQTCGDLVPKGRDQFLLWTGVVPRPAKP